MSEHKMHPESKMMSHGYNPEWSEGAIKCPIFQTSTFVFPTAEAGKAFFEVASGLREKGQQEKVGLIYSRLNNPDLEILEDRLCLWDEAEACAVFESGMSAISTALMEFLSPGDLLLFSGPLYGGSDHFIKHFLTRFGIHAMEFNASESMEDLIGRIREKGLENKLRMIFLETPANPTNCLYDISLYRKLADYFSTADNRVLVGVDNTYLGPVFQHPLKHGADLVIYSATKYIGGHSDVIAGACLGSKALIQRIKGLRTYFGNMAGPWTGWLLMRSLETLKIRMERQAANASVLADYLTHHPKIHDVHYLGYLTEADGDQYEIFKKQCLSPGAMISFEVGQTEEEAFAFLNKLKLIKLAVSLGSTESLIQHPASMTHAGVAPEDKIEMGIKENLIRLSVGVEHPDDLIYDIRQALEKVPLKEALEV
ncbi:MAG: cystathionine gamma-synthase family protein [Saprospirales bacterium]|nr:cystathionine gamma-synthase family protein [Saprospirales bacterium]